MLYMNREGCVGRRKAQTTPDASFELWAIAYRYVFFFSNFDSNLFFIVYIDIYVLYGVGGLHWAAMKAQTTPDASFELWAIAYRYVFFFLILILTCFLLSI